MAEELILVIENPNEGEFLKHIDWNKQEFMELVESVTEQYKGLTYTNEQIKDAKSDRAKLNAMKKAISDRRIQVKKAVMEPYTLFETEVSEVVALIEKPINMIDCQIKEYEERVKNEKKQNLKKYFEENASDLDGILTFDRIFDQRYLNATVSLNKACGDILEKVERVRTDIRSLETFCEEKYLTTAKDVYVRTLNVSEALAEVKRLKEFERKAEEERLRREEEAERAILAAKAKHEENVSKPDESVTESAKSVSEVAVNVSESVESVSEPENTLAPAATIDVPASAATALEEDGKQYKASFTVYGTKAEIMHLKQFMIEHNIKFGKAEK